MLTTPEQGFFEPSSVSTTTKRILVVDDEEVIRVLLSEILTDEGFEIVTASGGREAINYIESEHFDLVISDMVMPDVNGVEVLQAAFRADPEYAVIIITGFPSVDTAVKLVNLGAADYVTKPFNVDTIKITVAKVIESKKVREAASNSRQDISNLSGFDEATGAYSSNLITQLLENEIGRARLRNHSCSIVLLCPDSDDPAPDYNTLLKNLVNIAKSEIRPGDTLGRIDEQSIGVLLPETSRDDAVKVCERIRHKTHPHMILNAYVVNFPDDASDASGMLEVGRTALRAAQSRNIQ